MQFCMQCGQQNDDDSLFCIACGAKIEPLVDPVSPEFAAAANAAAQAQASSQPQFQPLESAVVADAFASAAMPSETIDIYAAAAHAAAPEPEPEPAPSPEPMKSSDPGPAHATFDAFQPREAGEALEAIEDLDERLATVESLVKDHTSTLKEALDKLSEQFEGKISRNEHEATVLKNMSDEMQEYRDGLYAKLTLPLVRDIIEAREALGMALARNGKKAKDGLEKDVALCRDMLSDSLTRNQVQIVTSKPGDDFESFKHKIVGKVHTTDQSLHGKVAEVAGDSYKLGDQYIAPAMVKVYTIEEAGE